MPEWSNSNVLSGALIGAGLVYATDVKGDDTVESFRQIVDGEADDIPESCFLMCGGIAEVREKAQKQAGDGAVK